ncbi:MAG TPA: thermonuclease family protein [Azospirillaceae bacterium]|nr:thermonuclease family protein [Azospirillaceae bacterium]
MSDAPPVPPLKILPTRRALLALPLLLAPLPALSAPVSLPAGLTPGPTVRVRGVVDGDTVELDDGTEVRLVGTQAPKLALGRRNFPDWPLSPESRDALARLARGRTVTLHTGGTPRDRHGRALAHLVRDDGLWLQGEMLRSGWTRLYTFPDNRAAAAEMRAAEAQARKKRANIWAHPFYAVRTPDRLAEDMDTFQLVEGRVARSARVRDRIYVNFGRDYRDDFTVEIERRHWRDFEAAGLDPLSLGGRRVEVRGWIGERNGPVIQATHPEQMAVLD